MAEMHRAGILTGGGDSPGINAATRSIVRYGLRNQVSTIGFLEGWKGLIEDLSQPMGMESVSGILPVGGTILGSSRTNPFNIDGGVDHILETLKRNAIDFLITIGGDDTLGVAHKLADYGVKAIGIPQTIDNDIAMTDYCIGFSSALGVITNALDRLHTTAFSHHRILIVEVMGRNSGWLSLMGGVAGGADVIILPEKKFDVNLVQRKVLQRQARKKRFSIIIIAEGAEPGELKGQVANQSEVDEFGHARLGGISQYLANELSDRMELPVRVTNLAYLQRGGSPSPFDRILATRFGASAVRFALEKKFDVMTALHGNNVEPVSLEDALSDQQTTVDTDLLYLVDLFE